MKKLVFGTRASELARAQTALVQQLLRQAHPDLPMETRIIQTEGDRNLDADLTRPDPLAKGLFTKQLEVELMEGRIDVAIHSLKDLPVGLPDGLVLGAIPEREDPSDTLVSKHPGGLAGLPEGACVATSSARRRAILGFLRPDLRIVPIRGNVPTRLRKLQADPALDATVLAQAGINRLGIGFPDTIHPTIEKELLPAPGQGALGVECRESDRETRDLLARIHHEPTAGCVHAERALLASLGGGCAVPLGALAIPSPTGPVLRSIYFGSPGS